MSHQKEENTSNLKVIARSPFHLYFDGKAQSVTAVNKVGEFDILPGHASFFSILDRGEITIKTDSEPVVIDISNGIITVRDDEVLLFVNM